MIVRRPAPLQIWWRVAGHEYACQTNSGTWNGLQDYPS